jgi:hypothetical protein
MQDKHKKYLIYTKLGVLLNHKDINRAKKSRKPVSNKSKSTKIVKNNSFKPSRMLIFSAIFAIIGLVSLAQSFAAPSSNRGGGKPSGTNYTLSTSLIMDGNVDGLLNFKDQLTFVRKPEATTANWVDVACSQAGRVVYTETRGFFSEYPWGTTYTLGPTGYWTGGAADCKATWYTLSNNKRVVYTTLTFSVNP